jgi:hypothetical protein
MLRDSLSWTPGWRRGPRASYVSPRAAAELAQASRDLGLDVGGRAAAAAAKLVAGLEELADGPDRRDRGRRPGPRELKRDGCVME